ncbi:hypothetical protein IQ218_03305 [Synechocystis salina LEGE 06099]|uniref:hypothetical protein n=1 Tax=Synechocystis salina TaxID=945780 RepID=UPI001882B5F2|nr:hypothetical protein [Synechocystis salina]MBE9202674.1 hypothetical protein [Synechocystis salina LEGE 06099]
MANPFDVALTNLNSLYSGIPDVPVLQTYNSLNPYDISLTNLNNLSNFVIEPAVLPTAAGTYGPQISEIAFALGGGIITGALADLLSTELGIEIENEALITKFLSFWLPVPITPSVRIMLNLFKVGKALTPSSVTTPDSTVH